MLRIQLHSEPCETTWGFDVACDIETVTQLPAPKQRSDDDGDDGWLMITQWLSMETVGYIFVGGWLPASTKAVAILCPNSRAGFGSAPPVMLVGGENHVFPSPMTLGQLVD